MTKILIVEDDLYLGILYKRKLEASGFIVVWAKSGDAAENSAIFFTADFCLLENNLRGKRSGIDILPNLKKTLPNATFWILLNEGDQATQKLAIDAGADRFIEKKNYPPNMIVKLVANHFWDARTSTAKKTPSHALR